MAAVKKTRVLLFDNKYGFMETIKHYNDVKVGYDGLISNYGRSRYGNYLPETKFGNVRLKDTLSYRQNIQSQFQNVPEINEALEWQFSIPIQQGFKVDVEATLSTWDNEEIASFKGTSEYIDINNKSPNINSFSIGNAYGYMEILLTHKDGKDFLQDQIRKLLDKGLPITNRLLTLNVKQIVYPHNEDKNTVTDNYSIREDSIIIELQE